MENQNNPFRNPEDELLAENNLLKIKLGLEHGMSMSEMSMLSPEMENQWLKHVYAFEQQYKDVKSISVYDFICRPSFKKIDALQPAEIPDALQRLKMIMASHGVELDCLCDYDDATIYRFITEELFSHEMDDMHLPGMTVHFIYEEFHPNHDHDVRQLARDFVRTLFTRLWDEEFDCIILAKQVSVADRNYDHAGISAIIRAFQEAHVNAALESFAMTNVVISDDITRAHAEGTVSVSAHFRHGGPVRYDGPCSFDYVRENDYWGIAGFRIPGFIS